MRKPTKTISGVAPIAVMAAPRECKHGSCIYCPSLDVPKSYTPESPAVMRAAVLNYDAYKQVKVRLKAFEAMKHPTDKIELIIMGGTFLAYPLHYQYDFVKRCYDALNKKNAKNLKEAKKLNEKAKHRCVALCIETRPDVCGKREIKRMLDFGATRCELGIQAIDDKIYKRVKRGHSVKHVIKATKMLKDAGFKVGYHLMPGLPGSSIKHDEEMFKKIFSSSNFKPDQLKIYPTQVIKGSELEKIYRQGKYKPYSEEPLVNLIIKFLKLTPEYCRVMRIMREIPPSYLVAGTKRIDLRKVVQEKLDKKRIKLGEIRSREIGFARSADKKTRIKIIEYGASRGKEYFLQIVNKQNILFALCRLRICKPLLPELKNAALVRELHVYGPAVKIGKKIEEKGKFQHIGFGKALMKEVEKIAKKEGMKKIAVISGVGAREYFRKLGYELQGAYMVKQL